MEMLRRWSPYEDNHNGPNGPCSAGPQPLWVTLVRGASALAFARSGWLVKPDHPVLPNVGFRIAKLMRVVTWNVTQITK
jgi:hypothetical protein